MAAKHELDKLDFEKFSNIINGQATQTESAHYGINPANNETLLPSPLSTRDDVEAAVSAARTAFKSWKKTPVALRKEKLLAFSAAVAAHKAEFSRLLTTEQGKPFQFAEQEVDFSTGWLTGTCQLDIPEDVVEDTSERYVVTQYVPLGVVVGIVPWNFPIMLLCGKLAPAVMTGNCIIIKPSPFTPYCGIKIVELAQRFFPPGVIQVLGGNEDLGPWLTAHPGIDKISFTGSTATGKRIMESASKNLTRVTLELGGNDAAVICSDADVEAVAPQIAHGAFLNSGQICIAIKRIYVHSSIYQAFKDCFLKHVSMMQVGDGTKDGIMLGPVQNKRQYECVKEFLTDVRNNKQTVLAGGDVLLTTGNGYFIQPTVVDNPPDDSKIVVEEPFGPVVPLLQWSNVDDVIDRVNATEQGLGASVWTNDQALALRIADDLDVGSVWINAHLGIQPTATFGGHKKSGIGREWGLDGLRGYCNSRTRFLNQSRETIGVA